MKTHFAILILLFSASGARACLREQIDEKAIQWSSQIIEARLVEVSERIEMKAVVVKPPVGSKAGEVSAVYWYRIYSFEVEKVIESSGNSVKPRFRIEVVRFFGKVDNPNASTEPAAVLPTACARELTRGGIGHSFLLLLKGEQDIKMEKPPVWSDNKNLDPRDAEVHGQRAYAVVHMMPKEKAAEAEMAKLRQVLAQTRAAEKKVSDNEIRKSIDVIAHAGSDAQAEAAIEALRKVGFKAVSHIKSARDRKETPAAGKERLAKLAIELSPTPLSIMVGEHQE